LIEFRPAADDAEVRQALELRRSVFVDEQGVPAHLEADGRDHEATHLVAVADGHVVATLRLVTKRDRGAHAEPDRRRDSDRAEPRIRLGRLAVAPAYRRRGLASALLAAAEREVSTAGGGRIVLHAQTYACGLYAAAGYECRGGPFQEAGVEHITMERHVA
jgi:predicted GNAT family N-acyltransferase